MRVQYLKCAYMIHIINEIRFEMVYSVADLEGGPPPPPLFWPKYTMYTILKDRE